MRDVIFGLARPMLRLLGRDDRGAVAVLVAVLLGGGVLLGMGALVIDVGRLYQNRAELQNGADASALAVARNCALSTSTCTLSNATNTAVSYADANASQLTGHSAGVYRICVSVPSSPGNPGFTFGTCPPLSTTAMTNCPSNPAGKNYVDVKTYTQVGSSHVLPTFFVPGGRTVYACAQAEWGGPSTANTVGFTISACSWYAYTNDGGSFAQPPPYPPDTPPTYQQDHILFMHGKQGSNTNGCPPYQPSGQDGPGNFSWVGSGNPCTVFISGGTYNGNTGASASGDCQTKLQSAYNNKTVLYVPVYSSITGQGGNNVSYTLLGFAAFVVTGYDIGGSFRAADWLNPANNNCGNPKQSKSDFCINGYFTQSLISSVGGVGGQNLGATAISLTG
jgi:Flp pilus assembly protein TadG